MLWKSTRKAILSRVKKNKKQVSKQRTLKGSVPDQEENRKHRSMAHSEQCRPFSTAGVFKI